MACGSCFFCQKQLFSCCDNSNPNAKVAEEAMGQSPSGLFGDSHTLGGFPGGQAEFVRVSFADVGTFKVPDELPDEKVLFLTDILPTGYMAAEQAAIEPGENGGRLGLWCRRPVRHPECVKVVLKP
jgi:threonine dehydrogenase-like Zn-dependent dehydrogenase